MFDDGGMNGKSYSVMTDGSKILMLLLLGDKTTRVKPADSCVWEQTQVP